MPTFLAIDYGRKRIGLAIGDSGTGVSSPIAPVAGTGDEARDVASIVEAALSYGATEYVLGLPVNMDGTEGEQARITRRFGSKLKKAAKKPVHYWDERLSSSAAEEKLLDSGLQRKKRAARLDSVAAQNILQEFLDNLAANPNLNHGDR